MACSIEFICARFRVTTRDPNADHAGGDAAAFGGDPAAYEFAVAQYLGAGVAACYRGSRPYSMPAEKAMLTKWIGFYKAHRGSLLQPIVHIRRADMQSWDGWLHVRWLGQLGRCQHPSPALHVASSVALRFPHSPWLSLPHSVSPGMQRPFFFSSFGQN